MRAGDYSVIWPIEAKVLKTDRKLAPYLRDLDDKYLKCKAAPFSHEGALIGYLIYRTRASCSTASQRTSASF